MMAPGPRASGAALVLIGLRGAGKSAAAKLLGRRLGAGVVDLDLEVERLAGASVTAVFARGGEPAFRELEARALAAVKRDALVLATGGGVVLRADNRARLKQLGRVVWLRVTPEEAARRTRRQHGRPPLTTLSPLEEARELERRRRSLYEATADAVVETDGRPLGEICDELERLWRGEG